MTKRVLSVGQCGPDHGSIRALVERNFDAIIVAADRASDTFDSLSREHFDLVLVNRRLDADYSEGIEIIRHMKADPTLSEIPVMLVTNFPEHQQQAVAAGAEQGFGKLECGAPETLEKLTRFLG